MAGTSRTGWASAVGSPAVREILVANRTVHDLRHVAEVGSTQDVILTLAVEGARAGTAIVTDRQRDGRGRSGNRWDDDPAGGSLALSLLLDVGPPPLDGMTVPLVPLAFGLAVVDACGAVGPPAPALRLKWPNDVVLRDDPDGPSRKLAGVLVERDRIDTSSGTREVLRCGIGLNVEPSWSLPPDRTDLTAIFGVPPDRAVLLAALLRSLDDAVQALAAPLRLLDRLRAVSDTIGRRVRVQGAGGDPLVGLATGIDDAGRLLVTSDGRTRAILSGTVRDADEEGGPA